MAMMEKPNHSQLKKWWLKGEDEGFVPKTNELREGYNKTRRNREKNKGAKKQRRIQRQRKRR